MFHRNNPKYTSNSISTLLKNEQVIVQERVCIYGVIQCGNKTSLSLMMFIHQWKKTPLYYMVFPPVYTRRGETPCAGFLEEGKHCKGVSRYLRCWVNWRNRVGVLLSYTASCMFRSGNSKKADFVVVVCRWRFFYAEKVFRNKTVGELKAWYLLYADVLDGHLFCSASAYCSKWHVDHVRASNEWGELLLKGYSGSRPMSEHSMVNKHQRK